MRSRGVLKERGWRLPSDRLGSGDDITVFVIPLAGHEPETWRGCSHHYDRALFRVLPPSAPETLDQWGSGRRKNLCHREDSGLTSTFINLPYETQSLHFILNQELSPICFGWSSVMQLNMFSDIKVFSPKPAVCDSCQWELNPCCTFLSCLCLRLSGYSNLKWIVHFNVVP